MTCSRCGEIPIHREDEESYVRQFPINQEFVLYDLTNFPNGEFQSQPTLQCPSCPKNYQLAIALGGIFLPMFVAYTITRK